MFKKKNLGLEVESLEKCHCSPWSRKVSEFHGKDNKDQQVICGKEIKEIKEIKENWDWD